MPLILETPNSTHHGNSEVTSPDWNIVPFEVGCARCGQDLRGLSEPKCPACGLEFEWSKAVPIEHLTCRHCHYHLYGLRETRCPECGEPFTWKEVLDDYHRRQKPLFEYRWRDRPIRSLLYTWWLAVRPWRLWRAIDIHDPPRTAPLIIMIGLSAAAVVLAGVVPGTLAWVLYDILSRPPWTVRSAMMPSLISQLHYYVAMSFDEAIEFVVTIGYWAIGSFLALLVFQQSMQIYKVRTNHVFRLWVYTVAAPAPLACLMCFGTLAALRALNLPFYGRTEAAIAATAFLILVLYSAMGFVMGYRRYLYMPHSTRMVIASQIIALLASAIACCVLVPKPSSIIVELLMGLELW